MFKKLLVDPGELCPHNAGGVRQSVAQGQLTLADVMGQLLPFELPLVKRRNSRPVLYQALESAINAATNNSVRGTGAAASLYTYGLRYYYDGRRPLGERLFRLEMMQPDSQSLCIPLSKSHCMSEYRPLTQLRVRKAIIHCCKLAGRSRWSL